MKTVLIALLISVCTAGYAEADKLPVNPWNTSRHTVKINKTEENPRPDVSNSAETPRWVTDRVEAVRRNNARVQAEYDAAENAANSRRQSQTSENNGGILDKLGGFFSDDKKAIVLDLNIDTEISSVLEYFEIFMERMLLCKRAALFFDRKFKMYINGSNIL